MIANERFKQMESGVFPPTALGTLGLLPSRSPLVPGATTSLQVSPELLNQYQGHNRNSKLFEVWANLFGEVPPVNCIGYNEGHMRPPLVPLFNAYRCYRGVERGWNDQDEGHDIYILITKPEYTYEYIPSMVCTAKCIKLEDGIVMATLVRMNPLGKNLMEGARGEVIGWDFIRGEIDGRILLPENAGSRYKEVVW